MPEPTVPGLPHRATFTVNVTSRPDGGHYFDRDDFTAHVAGWLKAALKRGHAIAEVTVTEAATNRAALAEDLRYVLNYRDPGHAHDRPGIWNTSGKPCDHCARLAVAQRNLAAYDADPDAVLAVLPAGTGNPAAALREAANRIHELRMAESEWLPATGLHKAEQELRRLAAEEATR